MWDTLDPPWRACLEEAWASYCAGSLPIGAAVVGADGRIVARGRNRIFEDEPQGRTIHGHLLAHAEMNALLLLDHAAVDPRSCTLFTTTEPCPLCTGAIRMLRIGEVRYLVRDGAAGSIGLLDASPFMRRAGVRVVHAASPELEAVVAALHVELVLRTERAVGVVRYWEESLPQAVALGRAVLASGELAALAGAARPAEAAVELLAERLAGLGGAVGTRGDALSTDEVGTPTDAPSADTPAGQEVGHGLPPAEVEYRVDPPIQFAALDRLYAAAWPNHRAPYDFGPELAHALCVVAAYEAGELVGFVRMAWDGRAHAFLLEPTVRPDRQRRGIGRALVERAVAVAGRRGVEWVHVDYEPRLAPFYRACGFRPTEAGLIRLR